MVAPTSVNGGRSSGIAVAPGALADDRRRPGSPPSRRRASPRRAGPSGGSRRGRAPRPRSSEDSIAARSPACWMAGPLVTRSGAPSSCATIIASVVLPSPGGPESRTWSGAWPRPRAASSTSDELLADDALPDELVEPRGRSAASTARSSSSAPLVATSAEASRRVGPGSLAARHAVRPRWRSAARRVPATSVPAAAASDRRRRPARRPPRPHRRPASPTSPSPTRASTHLLAPGRSGRGRGRSGRRRRHAARRAGRVSSSTIRCGALAADARAPRISAVRSPLGDRGAQRRRACARRASPGPAAARPRRRSARSRRRRARRRRRSRTGSASPRGRPARSRARPRRPTRRPASVRRGRLHQQPDAADLDDGGVEPDGQDRPRTDAIIELAPRRTAPTGRRTPVRRLAGPGDTAVAARRPARLPAPRPSGAGPG